MPNHCCEQMKQAVEQQCPQHPDRHACPDSLVDYCAQYDEYGLIVHDGGSSVMGINFCPWCGKQLPESLRDRWFAELEAQGIDPGRDEIPERYITDAWFREPGGA